VSDVSRGPGWWQASDGKWYSPDQVPGDAAQAAVDAGAAAGPGPELPGPGPAPGYPPPGYPPPGYPPPAMPYGPPPAAGAYGYPVGGPGYGYPAPAKTNGLAIASMVCSFFFWIYGIPAVLAVVFGFIARGQIKRSNGTQTGAGMALAGIIVGIAGLVIGTVLLVVALVVINHCSQNGNCSN